MPTPEQTTVVTGHRMAFSISQQQTVLWDQIQYSGSPQDFAWVLPVHPGAQVQLSHDAFFAALDALTDPVITGPTPNCGGGSSGNSGFGCGSSAADNASAGGAAFNTAGNSSVQVVSQSVVGPYDTVTLHSTDPNALYDWLTANSYAIPDTMRPIIDAYVAGGFDFLALRLAPGEGVQAMQPVRVVSPGAGLTLPLRMVSAGVGASVGITLYVIGEGRYEPQNFPDAVVDPTKLVWLHAQNTSNYETLAEQLMQQSGGQTWLTEYAEQTSLSGEANCSNAGYYGGSNGGVDPETGNFLSSYYFSQCQCPVTGQSLDASFDGLFETGPAADASGSDALAPEAGAADGGLTPPDGGDTGAALSCDDFDDLTVAATGMDPTTTWVTRLRAILPSSALGAGDLVLQASATQGAVSNQLTASVYDDPSYNPCPPGGGNSGGGCSTVHDDEPDGFGRWLIAGSLAFVGLALARRRRR
jgi:hypothetical protein